MAAEAFQIADEQASSDLDNPVLISAVDAAGQRLFRELVVSRIAWTAVNEATKLVSVDVICFSLRASGCSHAQPCELADCLDHFEMRAVLGNRGPRLPGLSMNVDRGLSGQVLASGRTVSVPAYGQSVVDGDLRSVVVDEEGLRAVVGVPVAFGGMIRGVMLAGRRNDDDFSPESAEILQRLCNYAGAALTAAYDRARVEEVATLRERRRLGRALHDDFGQHMFAIGMAAEFTRSSVAAGRPDVLSHLTLLDQNVRDASSALRSMLFGLHKLRPPERGLVAALRDLTTEFGDRTGTPTHLFILGQQSLADIPNNDVLVRIALEGLHNIERHANAQEVVVTLICRDASLEIAVQDDGAGFRERRSFNGSGLGLDLLSQEIGLHRGELRLARNEDGGSTLRASLPLR